MGVKISSDALGETANANNSRNQRKSSHFLMLFLCLGQFLVVNPDISLLKSPSLGPEEMFLL